MMINEIGFKVRQHGALVFIEVKNLKSYALRDIDRLVGDSSSFVEQVEIQNECIVTPNIAWHLRNAMYIMFDIQCFEVLEKERSYYSNINRRLEWSSRKFSLLIFVF